MARKRQKQGKIGKKRAAARSVDQREVKNFARLAETWWDPKGPMKPLHAMNPVRLGYIRDAILKRTSRDLSADRPLSGFKILDIGCGGGLLCEPLARLGASVTGIDAGKEPVAVAKAHAKGAELAITYRRAAAEDLAKGRARFDAVIAMEVVEHVADVESFLKSCRKLLKPGGVFIFSTLSKTPKAYFLAILGAEYVMRWLPKGTHQYGKFLKPSQMARRLKAVGLEPQDFTGFVFNPLKREWQLSPRDLSVNYAGVAYPA